MTTCQTCGQEIADAASEKVRQGYIDEAKVANDRVDELKREAESDAAGSDAVTTLEVEVDNLRAKSEGLAAAKALAQDEARDSQAAEVSLASLNAQAASYREHIAKAQAPGHDQAKQAAEVELAAARDAVSSIDTDTPDLDALKRAADAASYSLNVAQTAARTAHEEVVRAEAELERIAKAEGQLAEQLKLAE